MIRSDRTRFQPNVADPDMDYCYSLVNFCLVEMHMPIIILANHCSIIYPNLYEDLQENLITDIFESPSRLTSAELDFTCSMGVDYCDEERPFGDAQLHSVHWSGIRCNRGIMCKWMDYSVASLQRTHLEQIYLWVCSIGCLREDSSSEVYGYATATVVIECRTRILGLG